MTRQFLRTLSTGAIGFSARRAQAPPAAARTITYKTAGREIRADVYGASRGAAKPAPMGIHGGVTLGNRKGIVHYFKWAALCLVLPAIGAAQSSSTAAPDDAGVRRTVEAFYKSFSEGFVGPADFAAEDWNHINPNGGRDRGRDATLKSVRQVHQRSLKGTTDTVESMDVRFADSNVAVATVISVMSPYTSPNGVKHGLERHIRTFVVVNKGERWRIMQDQNTTIKGRN